MAFRKSSEARPQIREVSPAAAIPGGEFQIRGKGLAATARPHVRFGEVDAPIVIGSDSFVIVRVPEGASAGEMTVGRDHLTVPWTCGVGILVADTLHPVANPVVDHFGNIYTTFSGSPGQKTPVSIYKIDTNHHAAPFVSDLMNATGLALDEEGVLYASSRHDGVVYQISPAGNTSVYVEGMGVATGIAFDPEGNLYVGDRSGTIFKISRQRQIYVFATIEPSIAAYHLAFGPGDYLYVTGPTTSSFDSVHRISHSGQVETFYRGLGRPQGMAFDATGNLYVAASMGGRRGVVRIAPDQKAELFLSGPSIVGLAFSPSKALILATNNSIYRVDVGIEGRPDPLIAPDVIAPDVIAPDVIAPDVIAPDAEIIAVGSELLTPERLDTNSLYVTEQLNALGVEVRRKVVVGDDRALLAATVRDALANAGIVILSGGLGPTEDDLTRDAVADALGRKLIFSQALSDQLEERFRRLQRKMAENNRRQAYLVEGAEPLTNPRGSAPGQWIEVGHSVIILLPGPPRELEALFANECRPRLERRLPAQVIRTRFYRVAGMGESDLDQLIAPVYSKYTNPVTTILAGPGDIQIHLRARCATADEAERLLAEIGPPIEALLGDRIYSRNGESLESVIGSMLRERGATLAVAESCTAGMLGERITTVPGSSKYFVGGFLTYNDRMKTQLLGVDPALMERYTSVSEEVAKAMATGALARTGSTYAVSVTGEAGPESSTGVAPGTVFVGFATPDGTAAFRLHWPADRARVRALAAQYALDFLRRRIGMAPTGTAG